jgi:hypothetical protein
MCRSPLFLCAVRNNPTYSWMKTSKQLFYNLAQRTESDFDTKAGLALDKSINKYWKELGLGREVGCSPDTYSPYSYITDPTSFYNLLVHHIVTYNFDYSNETAGTPFFCTNAFALRDNLYKGRVVVNDLYTISPFNDTYYYFPNLTGDKLETLIAYLNDQTPNAKVSEEHAEIRDLHRQPSHVVARRIENTPWRGDRVELAESVHKHVHHYQSVYSGKLDTATVNGLTVDRDTLKPVETRFSGTPPPTERYWCTSLDIDDNKEYMLVAAEYDSFVIMNALNALFPQNPVVAPPVFYGPHGNIHSTALLDLYIKDHMPCPDSDTQ